MTDQNVHSRRPLSPESRYRLYLDESGDHVFHDLESFSHRYLALVGCWFRGDDYRVFHQALEGLKQRHLPHNPDEPVVLHREDIINRRHSFWRLRNPAIRDEFDRDLLRLIGQANFTVVAVVIDKKALVDRYPVPAHPYHLAMGFMLQRYCGYLNHVNRNGDVMAESRGGREDRLLKDSYARVYERGAWMFPAKSFQEALTTRELKLKPKAANIAGLQLADLIAHPVKQAILRERGLVADLPPPFADRLVPMLTGKFNRQLYTNRIEGYGKVLFPPSQ